VIDELKSKPMGRGSFIVVLGAQYLDLYGVARLNRVKDKDSTLVCAIEPNVLNHSQQEFAMGHSVVLGVGVGLCPLLSLACFKR
jgi:hypothetical protein